MKCHSSLICQRRPSFGIPSALGFIGCQGQVKCPWGWMIECDGDILTGYVIQKSVAPRNQGTFGVHSLKKRSDLIIGR
jgi:hypothetical protein